MADDALTDRRAAARSRLAAPTWPEDLARLGVSAEDRSDLLALLPAILADDDLLAAVAGHAAALAVAAGARTAPAPIPEPPVGGHPHGVEHLAMILAASVAHDAPRAVHRARGLADDLSWASLADLGQQLRVHRAVTGVLGLQTASWVALGWTGRLLRLGRLQFDVAGDPRQERIGIHIPADGPLDPDAVTASLEQARRVLPGMFPELDLSGPWRCTSWLFDPGLQTLGEESNLVQFQRRFREIGREPGSSDAGFFVFARRRGAHLDPAALPRDTRLRRLVADRLASGRPWWNVTGELES